MDRVRKSVFAFAILVAGFGFGAADVTFELQNNTKSVVKIGLGTKTAPPEDAEIEIKPGSKYPAGIKTHKLATDETARILIELEDKAKLTYDLNLSSKKNVKLKLTKKFFLNEVVLEAVSGSGFLANKDILRVTDEDPKKTTGKSAEQILDIGPSLNEEQRETKILGLKFSSDLKKATSKPDSSMPSSMQESEWEDIISAQQKIADAVKAQEKMWTSPLQKSAQGILNRLQITEESEQTEAAEKVLELIRTTYEAVEARFSHKESED